MTSAELLAEWHRLAAVRESLAKQRQRHSQTSQAWAKLMRRDSAVSGELHTIGVKLRALGVDPNR